MIRGKRFAETRLVDTGSWLGRAWQGRGLGTEMRCGALERTDWTIPVPVQLTGVVAAAFRIGSDPQL